MDERVRAWCCGCGWAHQGLTAGFLLLRYSAVYTVESLALFYPLLISRFVCTRRWYIDELRIFHVNQTSICLDSHQKLGWGWYRQTCSSPPVKYWPFHGGAFLWTLLLFVTVPCSIGVTCWEKTDLLGFVYAMLSCIFVMFPYGVLGQCWYLIVSIPNHYLIPKGPVTIRCIAPTYADVWKIQQVRCYMLSTLEISFKHVTNTL